MSYPHTVADCHEHHDLVRDFAGHRPPITVLCGSTRFGEAFRSANLRLTLDGHIVLSIGCDTKSDTELALSETARLPGLTTGDAAQPQWVRDIKARLDELHKRKIDLADSVLVLNVGGYIGESTRSEIAYALACGKPINYLEPLP